jgi:hypothetical protein
VDAFRGVLEVQLHALQGRNEGKYWRAGTKEGKAGSREQRPSRAKEAGAGAWSALAWSTNPALRLMTTAQRELLVAVAVTKNPSFHFLLIHLKGKESETL